MVALAAVVVTWRWHGVTLADVVMPWFLFMVGTSMAFSFKKLGNRGAITRKVLTRTAKLFILGILTQGQRPVEVRDCRLRTPHPQL